MWTGNAAEAVDKLAELGLGLPSARGAVQLAGVGSHVFVDLGYGEALHYDGAMAQFEIVPNPAVRWEPCRFGDRASACYHNPRCGYRLPGDWGSSFGRYVETPHQA